MPTNKATTDNAIIDKIDKSQVGLNMMPIATQYKRCNTKFMLMIRENLEKIK